MAKDNEFYVSNKLLYKTYCEWYAEIKIAQEEGIEEPKIPEFIVESMIKIATKLSYRFNFINYTFKDDMISDALYDCVRFSKKFNIERGDNPFSYLTTICFNAFLRVIDKEKKQSYIKSRIVVDTMTDFLDQVNTDDSEYKNMYIEFLRDVGNSDSHMPMSLKRTAAYKKQNQPNPLAQFETE